MMYVLYLFDPTASATAYGQRPKFAMAEQSATAEGENCAYGPTLANVEKIMGVELKKKWFQGPDIFLRWRTDPLF
jgi:hypothetical protein